MVVGLGGTETSDYTSEASNDTPPPVEPCTARTLVCVHVGTSLCISNHGPQFAPISM